MRAAGKDAQADEMIASFKERAAQEIASFSHVRVLGLMTSAPFTEEPEVWFHDLFRADLTPYSEDEVRFIREQLGR